MTYDPNANWTAKAQLAHQVPRYYITIEGVSTFRYSTGPVKGATTTYKPYMKTPRGVTQEIFPLQGRSTIGSLSIELVDVAGDVTKLVSPGQVVPTLVNREITLFGGYADLSEADYAELFRGQVSDWDMDKSTYSIGIRDLKRTTLEDIMTNATTAAPTTLQGNPINIWYALITGDFSNATFPVTVSGSTPTGLNIAASVVDATHLQNERDEWLFAWNMRFDFTEKRKAKDFFEKELFILKGYPLIRGSGKLSVRLYHPAHPAETPQDLTMDNTLGVPPVSPLFDLHLNDITISGDYAKGASPEFTQLFHFEDSSDITATKERQKILIESKGLRTDLDGIRNARFAGDRIRQRFLKPPLNIEAETLFSKRMLEVGDIVGVTHTRLPDMDTGLRGLVKEQCEVTRAVPDFRRGRMRFTLMTTNFGTNYRVIAPTNNNEGPGVFPDYTAQSAAQKAKYASIAATATEKFSNGDVAHWII